MNQPDPDFRRLDETGTAAQAPGPLPGVTWGFRDIVLGVFAALVAFLIIGGAVVGAAIAAFGEDALETLIAEASAVVILDVVLVTTVLLMIGRKGAGLDALGFRPPRQGWGRLPLYVVVAYFSSIALVNIYGIAIDVFGLDWLEPGEQLPDDFFDHIEVVVISGIAIVFMAPVAEEIFFRGFLFGGLRRYVGMPIAGLASGALFSLAHGDPGLVLPFAGIGLILAYAYERTGSLYTPIAIHFVFNTISFILLLMIPEWR